MIWGLIKLSILAVILIYLAKKYPAVKIALVYIKDNFIKLVDWIKSKFNKNSKI